MSAGAPDPRPWWASDGAQDSRSRRQDPLGAHRAARRGADTSDAAADEDRSETHEIPSSWFDAAAQLLGALNDPDRWRAWSERLADVERDDVERIAGHACGACPVCAVFRAVEESRPEVVDHLRQASRHLALALSAVLDRDGAAPRQGAGDPGSARVRRIDLDPDRT